MGRILFELSNVFSYLIIFPTVMLVFYLITLILSKRDINNNNIGIYGWLMSIKNIDILKISLLVVFYISVINTVITIDSNYYDLIFIVIPIVTFEIINKSYLKIFIDFIELYLLYFILIFKNIFFAYFINVTALWYIILLYVILCVFVLFFASYLVTANINSLSGNYINNNKDFENL